MIPFQERGPVVPLPTPSPFCWECKREITRAELITLQEITGYSGSNFRQPFHPFGGGYCADCVDIVRARYTATCYTCQQSFLTWQENRLRGECPTCAMKWSRQAYPKKVSLERSRARKNGCPATLTVAEWIRTLEDFKGLCAYCKERPALSIDHFIPIICGGGTTAGNCIPACQGCNTSKCGLHPDDRPSPSHGWHVMEEIRTYLATRVA